MISEISPGLTPESSAWLGDLPLVAVGCGGVDEPVTAGDRTLNGTCGLCPCAPIQYAKPESWHLHTVVQSQNRTLGIYWVHPFSRSISRAAG